MSPLRVIAGLVKGHKLKAVPGDTTRPITDRTKESLFNIIGQDIRGSSILDLFAGTGSVAIEALSRGAEFAFLIDNNRRAIQTIRANLQATGFENVAVVHHFDTFRFLQDQPQQPFDYVYIAPPQYKDLWIRTIQTLDVNIGWLSMDAWVIVQIHPVEYQHLNLSNLDEFDRRSYGSTLLVFYQRIEEEHLTKRKIYDNQADQH